MITLLRYVSLMVARYEWCETDGALCAGESVVSASRGLSDGIMGECNELSVALHEVDGF